jgi:hypothetical protein
MATAIKLILYVLIMTWVYADEYNIPVMLYIKRGRYLVNWKIAAFMQRQAICSYQSYVEEAEVTRG